MIEVLQSIIALIVTLSILVTIHEYGHYWVARRCNVHVQRFSVGFGKPLFVKRGVLPPSVHGDKGCSSQVRDKDSLKATEFVVAAIPLGGFVKMLDEREGFVPEHQKHLAFNNKSVLQRIAIVSAGPLANFLLAIIAYWMLFLVGVTGIIPKLGEVDPESRAGYAGIQSGDEIVAVDGHAVRTWADVNLRLFERLSESGSIVISVKEGSDFAKDHVIPINHWLKGIEEPQPTRALGLQLSYPIIPAVIGDVVVGGRAAKAGLKTGDRIAYANNKKIDSWTEWVHMIQRSPEQTMILSVLRDDQFLELLVVPEEKEIEGEILGFIGVSRVSVPFPKEMQTRITYPVHLALWAAVERTWDITKFTLVSIKKMIMGAISPKNISGPITIAQLANATAQSGLESFIGFLALLSISLGVLNLLPIPVLDGGHLLYYFFELITGKPVPERIQLWGLQLGMFLIISIMFLAFYNDLTRL